MSQEEKLFLCMSCLCEQPFVEVSVKIDGKDYIEIYCNKCKKFITRLVQDSSGNFEIDTTVYSQKIEKTLVDAIGYTSGGTIKLSEEELERIKKGEIMQFHFHSAQYNYGKIIFLVGYENADLGKDSKLAKSLMKKGDVAPMRISKEQMNMIENSDNVMGSMIPSNPPFEIVICSERQYLKYISEKK